MTNGKPLAPWHFWAVDYRNEVYLYRRCSFQVRNIGAPGLAASDMCQATATTAVADPGNGNLYWRCPEHRGMVNGSTRGEVLERIPVKS